MRERAYVIDGQRWLTIARAAKLLRTNALGIRKLMGDGSLDWRQSRANSRTFVVCEAEVMKLRVALPSAPRKRGRPTKEPAFEPVRRTRGGLWQDHHLRLTLPATKAISKKADPGSGPG